MSLIEEKGLVRDVGTICLRKKFALELYLFAQADRKLLLPLAG
ncbi:hypothetical protein AVDCRST_MAG81-2508 [uncultured Synechococcales cyanobacterium]|uniref:Uncharacterized protein n=1 Tax=uncultured Synechococcales cyanobacterium TaxID=1936017 RepID=A0A6J4VFV0_9CYAN|nr:hypothetical protein AVDCRST_MAG81-2508 [uncultured Synechococcales cyanobacterium]